MPLAAFTLCLGTEVSCVYRQGGQGRRVHLLLLAPDLDTAARLNRALAAYGSLESDGRPTLSLSARDLTALALEVNPDCIVMPAHAWTPWYGVYGSKSGFDSLADAFGDMYRHIPAIETGLSSDPEMNWAIGELGDKAIVSFSDAHSLPRPGAGSDGLCRGNELSRLGGGIAGRTGWLIPWSFIRRRGSITMTATASAAWYSTRRRRQVWGRIARYAAGR